MSQLGLSDFHLTEKAQSVDEVSTLFRDKLQLLSGLDLLQPIRQCQHKFWKQAAEPVESD